MNKIKKKLFITLQILLLCSCNTNSGIRVFNNKYDTYEQMVEDYKQLDLNYDDKDPFYIKINFPNMTFEDISYYTGGTDYCINEGKIRSYKYHDPNHCSSLHNRESYVIYALSDDVLFTIVYRDKVENGEILEWKEEMIGNEYVYETVLAYYNDRMQSNLLNVENQNLITVRFKNIDQDLKSNVLNEVRTQVEKALNQD